MEIDHFLPIPTLSLNQNLGLPICPEIVQHFLSGLGGNIELFCRISTGQDDRVVAVNDGLSIKALIGKERRMSVFQARCERTELLVSQQRRTDPAA